MIAFPCHRERIAASALLLLSNNCDDSQIYFDHGEDDDDEVFMSLKKESYSTGESLTSSQSEQCSLSDIVSGNSSELIRTNRLNFNATTKRFHQMKFEVVRKSRSKHYRIFDQKEFTPDKLKLIMPSRSMLERSANTITTETSSCLSSSSSAISSAQSRYVTAIRRKELMKKHVASGHIRRRADAILGFLSGGCASEMRIRLELGDSPDTSKALRMLLKLAEINRSGAGGRLDPFVYKISQKPISVGIIGE